MDLRGPATLPLTFYHFIIRKIVVFFFYLDRSQLLVQIRPQSWTVSDSQRLGDHWEPGTCSFTEEGLVCPLGALAGC